VDKKLQKSTIEFEGLRIEPIDDTQIIIHAETPTTIQIGELVSELTSLLGRSAGVSETCSCFPQSQHTLPALTYRILGLE
jgi:hypothetical protein